MYTFRFRLFSLGVITGLFDPQKLGQLLTEAAKGGHRLLRREFTIEPARFLFLFKRLTFGLVFRRDTSNPEPDHEYRVLVYKTRLFSRTVDGKKLEQLLNEAATGGFELFMGLKFPTRMLFIFPRESYTFIFRRPLGQAQGSFKYRVFQTPYRFFSRTLDEAQYEQDLNAIGAHGHLKVTFRDERRVLGAFRQPTVVGIAEQRQAASMVQARAA